MNAVRHNFDLSEASEVAMPGHPPLLDEAACARINASWATLHEAANVVAGMAQLGSAEQPAPARSLMRYTPERSAAVERGLDDLSAVMHSGLNALLGANENGRDTTAAALTLWREFHAGRSAVLGLGGPPED